MGINEREIAGISITKITNDILVSPVELDGIDTVCLRVQATPETEPNERYILRIKLDRTLGDILLPLQSVVFTQGDIDGRAVKIIPFALEGIDFNEVSGFIAEASLDATIADIDVGVSDTALEVNVEQNIQMNVGSGGLAGFDIELTISDPLIAKFVGAFFPPSFPLSNTVPDPVDGAVVRIRGVDLADVVNAGAFQEVLATLDIQPLSIGVSTITARIVALDNEAGFPIQSVINNGSITVTA